MDYDDYLKTPWWVSIRRKRIEQDNYKCVDCGVSRDLEVHHLTYERIGRENLEDLVTLCKDCHRTRHRVEKAADARREAAKSLISGCEYSAKRDVYTLGFVGFAFGEATKRGMNLGKWDDLKVLRSEYCRLLGVDEGEVRIMDAQQYYATNLHEDIGRLAKEGLTARQIAKRLNTRETTVYKQLKRIKEIGEQMKKLDLSNVEAMEPGARDRIEAGGYVVRIIDVEDHEDREFLWLVFDIAEGAKKGFYTNDANKDYYANKPNKHGILLSYKQGMSENAKRMLKGRLKKFSDFNPGFDALAAWDAEKPQLFVGKMMGLAAGMEEYVYEGREDGKWHKGESIDWFHARWYSPEYIREGKFNVPDTVELSDEDKAKLELQDAGAKVSEVYDDIPFE